MIPPTVLGGQARYCSRRRVVLRDVPLDSWFAYKLVRPLRCLAVLGVPVLQAFLARTAGALTAAGMKTPLLSQFVF